jgi:hypothetical protein
MNKFIFLVTVECDTAEQAETVMSERLDCDEWYGFDYEVGWRRPLSMIPVDVE